LLYWYREIYYTVSYRETVYKCYTVCVYAEIRELDGDMQRLVYENYSKFIKATDMIREVYFTFLVIAPPTFVLQMKSDFHRMEDEMSLLSGKMQEIMSASANINSALANRRQQIAKLSGVHHLLKKVT